ncbi:hypothetical protein DMH27_03080 [Raoultella planticola]|nr:hypothetical protein [Raoultella planticola]
MFRRSGQLSFVRYDRPGTHFFQGTGIYGLPWTATVYGGSIISDRYFAAAVGWAKAWEISARSRWMAPFSHAVCR